MIQCYSMPYLGSVDRPIYSAPDGERNGDSSLPVEHHNQTITPTERKIQTAYFDQQEQHTVDRQRIEFVSIQNAIHSGLHQQQMQAPRSGLVELENGYMLNGVVYGRVSPEPIPQAQTLPHEISLLSLCRDAISSPLQSPETLHSADFSPYQTPIAAAPPSCGLHIENSLQLFPHYDFDLHALMQGYPHRLNFTAVEIIVFLPNLFRNSAIAKRFANNRLERPEHEEILREFRGWNCLGNYIRNGYLKALRSEGCDKTMGRGLWTRKTNKVPPDWDGFDIAMNEFVPDWARKGEVREAPQSVLFCDLMSCVMKMPMGCDAADLTRTIGFACGEEGFAWEQENGRRLMFPDDLLLIIGLIGHADITKEHRDRSVAIRYRNVYDARKKEEANSIKPIDGKNKKRTKTRSEHDGERNTKRRKTTPKKVKDMNVQIGNTSSERNFERDTGVETGTHSSLNQLKSLGSPSMQSTIFSLKPLNMLHMHETSREDTHRALEATLSPSTILSETESQVQHQWPLLEQYLLRNVTDDIIQNTEPYPRRLELENAVKYARQSDQMGFAWYNNEKHIAGITQRLEQQVEHHRNPSEEDVATALDQDIITELDGVGGTRLDLTVEEEERLTSELRTEEPRELYANVDSLIMASGFTCDAAGMTD